MTKSHQAVLAGATADRPTLYEAVRAARDGDFNPSDLFPSLLSYHDTLELARLLGRRSRGHDVHLDVSLVKEMKRVIAIRDGLDAMLSAEPEALPFDEQAAALVIMQAAYELHSKADWLETIGGAMVADSAITLTGRAGSAVV
jgi:hypothetical protein